MDMESLTSCETELTESDINNQLMLALAKLNEGCYIHKPP